MIREEEEERKKSVFLWVHIEKVGLQYHLPPCHQPHTLLIPSYYFFLAQLLIATLLYPSCLLLTPSDLSWPLLAPPDPSWPLLAPPNPLLASS